MRRLFVPLMFVLIFAAGELTVRADNQEEANKIARILGTKYPQYNIEVAYQDGRVRLRGDITKESDRTEITRFVKQMPQVKNVSDTFKVSAQGQSIAAMDPRVVPQPSMLPTTLPSNRTIAQGKVVSVSGEKPTSTITNTVPAVGNMVAPVVHGGANVQGGDVAGIPTEYMAPQGVPLVPGQNGQASLPNHAWPTYANYPNYSQVSYPKQYGSGAFPYVGPFYPYPQVPLGWRKVTMEWHDGYWWLDFNDGSNSGPFSPLFRQPTKYR